MDVRWLGVWGVAACAGGPAPIEGVDVDLAVSGDVTRPVNSFGTRMCVSPAGHVYVIWLDDRRGGDHLDLWLNRALASPNEASSWLPTPARVNHADAPVANPDLHCDDDGVYVVWEDTRDGAFDNHQIYANRSVDQGRTFLAEDVLVEDDVDGASMSLHPRIAGVGPELTVTWQDSAFGSYDILTARSNDAGETWRGPDRLDGGPAGAAYSARPRVAMAGDGSARWVVWEDGRDGGNDIYAAGSRDGGVTFEAEQRLDTGDGGGASTSSDPRICAGDASNVAVVWRDGQVPSGLRLTASADGGGAWSEPLAVQSEAGQGGHTSRPSCVASGNEVFVAWMDDRHVRFDVFFRRFVDGVPAGEELQADVFGGGNALEPWISLDPSTGVVAMAWIDDRSTPAGGGADGGAIYYQYFEAGDYGGSADREYRIDAMFDEVVAPRDLQFEVRNDTWFAAWTDGRGVSSEVRFHAGTLGTATVPPRAERLER